TLRATDSCASPIFPSPYYSVTQTCPAVSGRSRLRPSVTWRLDRFVCLCGHECHLGRHATPLSDDRIWEAWRGTGVRDVVIARRGRRHHRLSLLKTQSGTVGAALSRSRCQSVSR